MAEYNILVRARINAKNFDSAQKKCDDLKAKIEKAGADWSEVKVVGDAK